ncbi:hypothetical protein MBCUT_12860 [Methanobrevibacter cuticularis]|uniref:Uncharacterized protein n=1 Tax=Methanobrevibacter cuticularis TaxID=47311 RepID=A0A166DNB8_9EURY|nr:hypothetical protein [Methanobrevibacter cuticularis]KZX15783.1 hypothetical protein MBCUT_12860 [Methanobrevibacter cuticularis]
MKFPYLKVLIFSISLFSLVFSFGILTSTNLELDGNNNNFIIPNSNQENYLEIQTDSLKDTLNPLYLLNEASINFNIFKNESLLILPFFTSKLDIESKSGPFSIPKTAINSKNKLLAYGCCSIILQLNNSSSVYAYRRDSSYSANLYIENTKFFGKKAIKEYKLNNGYFFHTIISKDGWFVGTGGSNKAQLNKYLEKLSRNIIKKGTITKNDMAKSNNAFKKYGFGHFVVKSPEGYVGVNIYNNKKSKSTVFKMKDGEYITIPNYPKYYQKGSYKIKKSDAISAAIYIAAKDKTGFNRRNIMIYDVKRIDNLTKIKIWVSNDNGKYSKTKNLGKDNVIYKKKKTSTKSIPSAPNKKYIGEAILK